VREALLSVLQTLFANIQAINPENPWLQGQMEALVQATKPPLGLRRLEDVERRLKSLVIKQIEAQEQAQQAQQVMKESLSTFLQRLAQTADNSEKYQKQFEHCAQALQQAQTIADMAPVLDTAIQSARSLALDSRQTTEELTALRNRAEQAEVEVQRLRNELDRMSAAASHDMLTGALNRQGMGEVVDKEMARAQRSGAPLCMAMLDIDDFKRLNDRLGHLSGDAALKHLANVAKASLRTQDSVARFGGEEFVVILPDTSTAEATEVLTRLQRELTKELFLEGDQRILITFSAGVVQVQSGETLEQVLQRADLAMYAAKRAGKNRVVVA
jgi:diguanylate cyclase